MALNLVNNNYVGDLIGELATLLTIGSMDLDFFHVLQTNGSKVRFPYATVNTVIQTFDSLCDVQDAGDRSREIVDIELCRFIIQETACYDEEFETDYASANGSYEAQNLSEQIADWARLHIDNFAFGLQNVRWSGDTALASTNMLSKYDGVVKLIQAKGAFDAATNPSGYQQMATTAITSANAIQEIAKICQDLPLFVTNHKDFKIVVSPSIAKLVKQQIQSNNNTTGLTALPKMMMNAETGQITDGTFFGSPVYVAYGLDAVAANQNIILGGLFVDNRMGVLKFGTTRANEEKTLSIREVNDGDAVRFRAISSQRVAVIPNLSQVAMNA